MLKFTKMKIFLHYSISLNVLSVKKIVSTIKKSIFFIIQNKKNVFKIEKHMKKIIILILKMSTKMLMIKKKIVLNAMTIIYQIIISIKIKFMIIVIKTII